MVQIMSQKIYKNVFYVLIFSLFSKCEMQSIFKISVNEESPIGFRIGNIDNFVRNSFYDINTYDVTYVNKFFSIALNKDVIMAKVIDLEKICEVDSLCCNDEPCVIRYVVYITSENSKKYTFAIEVEIKDINDNKPIFKGPTQTISVPENSKMNTIFRLDAAIDNDVTLPNKIQRYKFMESTNTFRLDSTNLNFLKLVLQQPIDYETKKLYYATLSACEANSNCTTQKLIINISDENDNFPKFENARYEIKIKEDFPVRSVILKVRAIDLDGPKYNQTIYSFYIAGDRVTERFFQVRPESGEIVLRNRLSASSIPEYRFKISAMDEKMLGAGDNMDVTEVVIKVIDINDHKPTIELVDQDKFPDTGRLVSIKIKENEPAQMLISFKVSDKDLNENGKVSCELKDLSILLILKPFYPSLYEIWSVNPFDYEKDKLIRVLFHCTDQGSPQLSETKTIEINVEDVNEFPPKFTSSEYSASLRENAPPDTHVLQVNAKDEDGSATLIYSIDDHSLLEYFSIDSDTGLIKTSSISFDKEVIDSKEFFVSVIDDKTNPKTAQVLVKIEILDVNDNDPVFILSSLQFFVLENMKVKTKLNGILNATDRDKDKDNSFVTYDLVRLYDHMLMKCDKQLFRIRVNGEIETVVQLDRELTPNYTITVKAQDRGSPPRFTLANATVYIRDENDNAPQWQYPRPIDYTRYPEGHLPIPMINISESTDKMTLILKLIAYDVDDNEAGKVTFFLQNPNYEMFSLNSSTGELITTTAPLRHGQYSLQFIAKDNGNPSLKSEASILINVLDSGKLANINLTIIIGMIAITVLISIFLIVAIICVRRRPRFQKYLSPSSEVPNDNSNQYFNHNHWMYHSEDNPMPPLSDNESFVFLPQQYCPSNHPDQIAIQTMNGSRPASRMEYPLTLPSSNNFNTIDNNGLQMNQNIDILNGTLRSNNGYYGSNIPASMGVVLTGQELDGDSADSGKGASEVDLRLQHQLNIGNRNYTTMPFLHYSTATTSFGHYNNMAPNQYYSNNTNPRALDSRFLTVNTAHLPSGRRVASPSNSNCQCFILPEDDVIQINQGNGFSMSTFTNKSKLTNHEKNCVYNGDEMGPHFYPDYPPYGEASANMKDYVVLESNDVSTDKSDVDKSYNNLSDNTHNKNLFTTSDKTNPEKNFYSLGLAN